jgi:hypothetical protein
MRISVDRNDPGLGVWLKHRDAGVKVFLDGAEVSERCITADDEAGEVLLFKHDAAGKPVINATGNAIETETLRGVVKIVLAG